MTERVIVASKGRFSRAKSAAVRHKLGLPHESSIANDEFVEVTRDVWRIDAESARRVGHPAPFPIELPRKLIDLYTYRGDIVVDPFAGSGTTLVAAARTGRIGVGFDTDADYIALAQQRLDQEVLAQDQRRPDETLDPTNPPAVLGHTGAGALSFEDRQEVFQSLAIIERKKSHDIAKRVLTQTGFGLAKGKARLPSGLVEFTFGVEPGYESAPWWVEVAGSFTSNRPGLQRTDSVLRLLGKLHLWRSDTERDSSDRVLVLTPSLPKPGSAGDKALRAVGSGVIFDAIELYDPAGLERLGHYAKTGHAKPLEGFWGPGEV